MSTFLFVCFIVILLTIPGLLVVSSKRTQYVFVNKYQKNLLVIPLSYMCFVVLLGFFQVLGMPLSSFKFIVIVYMTVCLYFLIRKLCLGFSRTDLFSKIFDHKEALMISSIVLFFHILVGYYDEIPADIYQHLYYFQSAQSGLLATEFKQLSIVEWLRQGGLAWYYLVALSSEWSGTDIFQTIFVTTLLTKVIFLCGVYFFARLVFVNVDNVNLISLLSTLVLAIHMGVSAFAFVRYYSFAPTMVNMVLFFSIVALAMSFFEKAMLLKQNLMFILFIGFLLVASSAIHTQEALFAVVILTCLSIVYGFSPAFKQLETRRFSQLVAVLSAVTFLVIYFLARWNLEAAPNNDWRLWDFGDLNISFLPRLHTLNLKFQFIQVVTFWGCFVLILSLFFYKELFKNPYLLAGLISPFLTILNPFFIDVFLRLYGSTTVWRLTYLIPIHFLGAYFLVFFSKVLLSKGKLLKRLLAVLILMVLIAFLLPVNIGLSSVHYTRFPTFFSVNQENSAAYYKDALIRLSQIEDERVILTDPVTGYIVSGMTKHYSYRRKFFRKNYYHFTFENYDNLPLRRHSGKLLLINKRVGAESEVGRISGHWPKDILKLNKNYYPDVLISHLNNKPEFFKLLWTSDAQDISLYEIL